MNGLTSLILSGLFSVTFSAAILAGLIWLAQKPLSRFLAPQYRHALWLLVVIRLLAPIAPSSPLSLFNLLPSFGQSAMVQTADPSPQPYSITVSNYPETFAAPPLDPRRTQYNVAPSHWYSWLTEMSSTDWLYLSLFSIWLVGGLTMFLRIGWSSWRFSRSMKGEKPTANQRLGEILDTCRQKMKVRRKTPLFITNNVHQPALWGFWRPRLLLPPDMASEFTEEELRLVFYHELTHLKRRDVAVNWILALNRVIHWFNPVAWLAHRQIVAQREIACDAAAIQYAGEKQKQNYGLMLLRIAEQVSSVENKYASIPVGMTGMHTLFQRNGLLKERIRMIAKRKVLSKYRFHFISCLLIAVLAIVGLTNAQEESESKDVYAGVDSLLNHNPSSVKYINPAVGFNPFSNSAISLPVEGVAPFWKADKEAEKPQNDADPQVVMVYAVADILSWLQLLGSLSPEESWTLLIGTLEPLVIPQGELPNPAAEKIHKFESNLSIVVSQSQTAHEKLAALLESWRKMADEQVTIEVRFVSVTQETERKIRDFGVSLNRRSSDDLSQRSTKQTANKSEPTRIAELGVVTAKSVTTKQIPSSVVRILDENQLRQVLQASQGDVRSNLMRAPKVTLFNGQAATIVDLTSRPFVVDVKKSKNGKFDPIIKVLDEGTKIGLLPKIIENNALLLDCKVVLSSIQDVKVVEVFRDNMPQPLTVQVPEVQSIEIEFAAKLEEGKSILISLAHMMDRPKNVQGVPVPGRRRMFRAQRPQSRNDRLMLIITPKIIRVEDEWQEIKVKTPPK